MQHQSYQRKRQLLPDFGLDTDILLESLNFDESFEPIAIVTPPKKRAHTDTGASSYNHYSHSNLSSSYMLQQQQRRNSLQHFQAQQRRNSFQESYNALFQGSVMNSFDPLPYSSSLHPPMPPLSNPMDASMYGYSYASSTNNNSLYPGTAFASTGITSDMLEPLLHNTNSQSIRLSNNDSFIPDERDNQTCPDLCESSSSLLDEGNFIIQTSDSFKENNFAKAEIIPAGDFSTLNMLTNIFRKSDTTNAPSGQEKVDVKTTTHNSNKNEQDTASARFKPFHEEKWSFHYDELLQFKKENGHCLVPHTFPAKPHLARWVKRQRRQYKLKLEGDKNSTMTDERIKILNDIGFVWDSHEVVWNERFHQLIKYKEQYGNCKVPSYCKECPQLASWVKCQRRQYKLFWEEGKGSSMTVDRIQLLNSIGFIWEVHPGRKIPKDDEHYQHLATILMDGKS